MKYPIIQYFYLKVILACMLFITFWNLINYFIPGAYYFLTFLTTPTFLIVIVTFFKKKSPMWIYITATFITILTNDFLFRELGGGINDDVGKELCLLSFYATIIFTAIISIVLSFRYSLFSIKTLEKEVKKESKHIRTKVKNIVFFLVVISATILLYETINVNF